MKNEPVTQKTQSANDWQKAGKNLIRYVSSEKYYARIRVKGKLIVRSLKTKVHSVAKLRLADLEKAERIIAASRDAVASTLLFFSRKTP